MFSFAAIKTFFSGIWGYVIIAGAAVLAFMIALSKAKRAGKDEVKAEYNKEAAEASQRQLEVPFPSPGETDKALQEGKF